MNLILENFKLSSSFPYYIGFYFIYRMIGVIISWIDTHPAGVQLFDGFDYFVSYSASSLKVHSSALKTPLTSLNIPSLFKLLNYKFYVFYLSI